MNNELLPLIEKHTDTLIQQTETQSEETSEFKPNAGSAGHVESPSHAGSAIAGSMSQARSANLQLRKHSH